MEMPLWVWIVALIAFGLVLAFFLGTNRGPSGIRPPPEPTPQPTSDQSDEVTGPVFAARNAERRALETRLRRELPNMLMGEQEIAERLFRHKRGKHAIWDNLRCLQSVIEDLRRDINHN